MPATSNFQYKYQHIIENITLITCCKNSYWEHGQNVCIKNNSMMANNTGDNRAALTLTVVSFLSTGSKWKLKSVVWYHHFTIFIILQQPGHCWCHIFYLYKKNPSCCTWVAQSSVMKWVSIMFLFSRLCYL